MASSVIIFYDWSCCPHGRWCCRLVVWCPCWYQYIRYDLAQGARHIGLFQWLQTQIYMVEDTKIWVKVKVIWRDGDGEDGGCTCCSEGSVRNGWVIDLALTHQHAVPGVHFPKDVFFITTTAVFWILTMGSLQNILRMPPQLCCGAMCKFCSDHIIVIRTKWNKNRKKFSIQNIIGEMGLPNTLQRAKMPRFTD